MADDKKIIFSMVGLNKSFGPQKQVLKNIYLSFFYGAKIGIIGLNGAGKSTLLKIIAGIEKEYQGEVVWSPGYSVGYLEQDPKLDPSKTVREVVQEGVQPVMDMLKEYDLANRTQTSINYWHVRQSCKTNLMPRTHGISTRNWIARWTRFVARPTKRA